MELYLVISRKINRTDFSGFAIAGVTVSKIRQLTLDEVVGMGGIYFCQLRSDLIYAANILSSLSAEDSFTIWAKRMAEQYVFDYFDWLNGVMYSGCCCN